jgi:hypothetical protein
MHRTHQTLSNLVDIIACACLCLAGGCLLTRLAVESTIFNTDAAAPYYQAKLISSVTTLDPKALSFARIPSIFPDLATLIALTWSDYSAAFHEVFARYSWIVASLFIFLQSEISRLSLSCRLSRKRSIITTISIVTILASISPQFRGFVGILVTPLHHGGNVIATYLLGCLLVWDQARLARPDSEHFPIKILLAFLLISLGVASNKLLVFTGLAPAGLSIALAALLARSQRISKVHIRLIGTHRKTAFAVASGLIAGIGIPTLLNTQCSLPIIVRPLVTYKQYLDILSSSPLYVVGLTAAVALSLYAGLTLAKAYRLKTQKGPSRKSYDCAYSLFLGSTFLSMSALSPMAYIWALGEPQDLPLRYTIITAAGIGGVLTIIASILLSKAEIALSDNAIIKALRLSLASSIGIVLLSAFTAQSMYSTIENVYTAHFRQRNEKNIQITNQLHDLGLTYGLADFWGTQIEFASKLNSSGDKQITIQPILDNGKPDLWAHSKLQFKDSYGKARDYQFVLTANYDFEQAVVSAYGPPSQRIQTVDPNTNILVYADGAAKKKMLRLIEQKLADFERKCNSKSVDFAER